MEKKEQIKSGITAVLIVIFVFALNYSRESIKRINARRQKAGGPAALTNGKGNGQNVPGSEASVTPSPPAGEKDIYGYLEQQAKGLKLKKDPFSPEPRLPETKDAPLILDLSGIVWEEESPKAIINGNIVTAGDMVGTSKVIEIKQDRVIMSDGITMFELKIGGYKTK